MIMAIKRTDEEMVFNPGPDEVIQTGDILIVVGKDEDILRLKADVQESAID